jgi:hypothetical protein
MQAAPASGWAACTAFGQEEGLALINRIEVSGVWFQVSGVRCQVSVFSAASGLKSGQFDRKTDSSVVESDTRVFENEE